MKIEYMVGFSYNAGLNGSEVWFDNLEQAKEFANAYKVEHEDSNKMYWIEKYISNGRKLVSNEIVDEWEG